MVGKLAVSFLCHSQKVVYSHLYVSCFLSQFDVLWGYTFEAKQYYLQWRIKHSTSEYQKVQQYFLCRDGSGCIKLGIHPFNAYVYLYGSYISSKILFTVFMFIRLQYVLQNCLSSPLSMIQPKRARYLAQALLFEYTFCLCEKFAKEGIVFMYSRNENQSKTFYNVAFSL